MARVVRSLHRVYEDFDAQCVKVAVPMEILIGRIPVKILLLLIASGLVLAGVIPDTAAPNMFTAGCYWIASLAIVAAFVVTRIEKVIYHS